MGSVLLFLFELVLLQLLQAMAAVARSDTLHPHCQESCGNFSIPYPFGIGPDCYRDKSFEITCKKNDDGVMMPYSGGIDSSLPVFNFSVSQSQATKFTYLSYRCYNASGSMDYRSSGLNLSGTPFAISATRNKFTAIGCNTIAYIYGDNGASVSRCMSFCNKLDYSANGSCTGTGCCQTSLPENMVYYNSQFYNRGINDSTWEFDPCSYSFVADQDWFKFNVSYLKGDYFKLQFRLGVPLVLDWVAGGVTCEQAKKNTTSYACRSNNSACRDHPHGLGYTCNCSQGYEGNPYLEDGCQDIRECDHLDQYPCYGICENKEGGYNCSCPPGHHSDDPKTLKCVPNPIKKSPVVLGIIIGVSISAALLLLYLSSYFLHQRWKERIVRRIKEKHFRKNRGLFLQQLISSNEDLAERTKIFSLEELEKATNNFDATRILGHGGHGTVYKGILTDQRIAAIKKAKIAKQREIDEFINEVVILSQINHKNVVRLFGCCLESEVPLLVYEFVPNGTLNAHLERHSSLAWEERLRIATEASGALAYLHSSTSISIFHRDVKSSNILLDDNCCAKVSDFGASRSLPPDQTHLTTKVQGTFGYLDPEYYQTGQLTEKSDVYSFGVILLELLTGEKPISSARCPEEINLCSRFLLARRENQLFEIFEDRVKEEGTKEELTTIAMLAEKCLQLRRDERPTMKEVEGVLEGLRRSKNRNQQSGIERQCVHADDLRNGPSSHALYKLVEGSEVIGRKSLYSSRNFSLEKEFMLSLDCPR